MERWYSVNKAFATTNAGNNRVWILGAGDAGR